MVFSGSNYCGVHSDADFIKKMDTEFDYMVTPLVYNLKLRLRSEGDVAYISDVFGTNAKKSESLKNGEIMSIATLFPSPSNKKGGKKGGIVLLKVSQKNKGDDAKKTFNMIVEVSYEDKNNKKYLNKQIVEFGSDKKWNNDDYYDNDAVQKGILLSRYIKLIKNWIKHDRYYFVERLNNKKKTKKKKKSTKKKEEDIYVSNKYKKIFLSFLPYFKEQMEDIKDDTLKQEIDILQALCNENELE